MSRACDGDFRTCRLCRASVCNDRSMPRPSGDALDRDDDVTEPIVVEEGETRPGFAGQNVPRKEDKRLVQGEGVFFDDVKRHNMGYVHFVRSPYAHAKIRSVDVSKALEHPGVFGTLTGDEVALADRPVLPDLVAAGRAPEGLLPRGRQGPLRRRAGRGGRGRRRARSPATPPSSSRSTTSRCRRSSTRGEALDDDAPVLHDEAGTNLTWEGVYEWGDLDQAVRRGRPGREDLRAPLRPLQLDAARVQRRAGRVQPRHGAVDDHHEQPVPRASRRS